MNMAPPAGKIHSVQSGLVEEVGCDDSGGGFEGFDGADSVVKALTALQGL